jgi:hypothetical protein
MKDTALQDRPILYTKQTRLLLLIISTHSRNVLRNSRHCKEVHFYHWTTPYLSYFDFPLKLVNKVRVIKFQHKFESKIPSDVS